MNTRQVIQELKEINSNTANNVGSNVVITDINISGTQTDDLNVSLTNSSLSTSDTTTQTNTSNINTTLGTTNTNLNTINTTLNGTLDVQSNSANLATESTLSSIDTAINGTLDVQSNSANLATETTLSSIATGLSGTLQVQSNSQNLVSTSQIPTALGQQSKATALGVTLASDEDTLNISEQNTDFSDAMNNLKKIPTKTLNSVFSAKFDDYDNQAGQFFVINGSGSEGQQTNYYSFGSTDNNTQRLTSKDEIEILPNTLTEVIFSFFVSNITGSTTRAYVGLVSDTDEEPENAIMIGVNRAVSTSNKTLRVIRNSVVENISSYNGNGFVDATVGQFGTFKIAYYNYANPIIEFYQSSDNNNDFQLIHRINESGASSTTFNIDRFKFGGTVFRENGSNNLRLGLHSVNIFTQSQFKRTTKFLNVLLKNGSNSDTTNNYSTTATDFGYTATNKTYIRRLIIFINDGGIGNNEWAGIGSTLTNGIIFYVIRNDGTEEQLNETAIQSNRHLLQYFQTNELYDYGGGDSSLRAIWTFEDCAKEIELLKGEQFVVRLNDNFSAVTEQTFTIQGYTSLF